MTAPMMGASAPADTARVLAFKAKPVTRLSRSEMVDPSLIALWLSARRGVIFALEVQAETEAAIVAAVLRSVQPCDAALSTDTLDDYEGRESDLWPLEIHDHRSGVAVWVTADGRVHDRKPSAEMGGVA
ncbi:hypothetical protein CCR95_20890 [Thiocystis minor]|uniref:hypothetical protein n=1 Tax=Thiocystis minor TaxID=61597 RepID=UPI0019141F3B|nr:hypothetical protein [Thiocystis minor]MBK5966463.1 hypothetical protein [Thiocystis minor]